MNDIFCYLVLLLVSNLVESGTPPVCHLPTFLPATCDLSYKPQIVAGADGNNGLNGKRGHHGRRGEQGDAASFCYGKECKVENILYTEFTKLVDDVYWMHSTLDLIDGLDIGTMTKEELIKIILNQNRKIVGDHEEIDRLDKELEDLKKKLQSSGGNLGIIDELKKKLAEKIKENEEKDKKIKELNEKCIMINNAMKENVQLKEEINKLKNKINDLSEKLAEAGNSVKKLAELHEAVNKLHKELTERTKTLGAEIAKLKEELLKKGIGNVALQNKVKELENQIKVAHEACKGIEKQRDELMKHYEVLMETCKSNEAVQGKVIGSLKEHIEDLKNKCKNLGEYQHKIMELEKKLKELEKGKTSAAKTTGGNAGGASCVFPFIYKGKSYDGCTGVNVAKGFTWCSTTSNYDTDKKWGYCPAGSGRSTPKFALNKILCDGDTLSYVTTIPNRKNKINVFSKYMKQNIELPCTKGTDGSGPWFILLNREDGSVDFKKKWNDYKDGFGNPNGEFWLGLEAASILTRAHHFKLRVELEDHKGNKFYSTYSKFKIGKGNKYRLRIRGHHGNIYNALKYHNNMPFSTEDKDQDRTAKRHCAHGTGGWWFKKCHMCLLTGTWHKDWTTDKTGVRWRARRRSGTYGSYYSWKKARMLIQPVHSHYKGGKFKG